MTRSQIAAVLAAALAFSLTALAQEKKEPGAAMTPPRPSKDLEAFMKPLLEGTWTCDTKMMAGAMGPNSPEQTVKSKVKFMKDKETQGIWYRGEYAMPKSGTMPAMTGYFLISHDDANKQLTNISWDSFGGAAMGTGTLQGETMSWSGESVMMGQKSKFRDTFTKTGPKTVTHKYEADMGKGFQVMGEDTCTKGAGTT